MTRRIIYSLAKLEGYQAILKPSDFGYSLSAVLDDSERETDNGWSIELWYDRQDCLRYIAGKLKGKRNQKLMDEPWDERDDYSVKVKFSWTDETKPAIMDTDCVPVERDDLPLLDGCLVMIGFYQKPYILKDGLTYGTTLKLLGLQIVDIPEHLIDKDENKFAKMANLFGKRDGFKLSSYCE